MTRNYSIAEARKLLPEIVHNAERGDTAEITRRGKPVAILLSVEQYRRATSVPPAFAEVYRAWRASADRKQLDIPRKHFTGLRARSSGRKVGF